MKKLLVGLFFAALALSANAQFTPGRVLTAGDLNTAIANPTITGGTINNAPIGQGTPAAGKFTTLQATTSIAGPLNGSIGATVPSTGAFTAITAPSYSYGGNLTFNAAISGGTLLFKSNGTNVLSLDATGVNNTAIGQGASGAAAGAFSSLRVTSAQTPASSSAACTYGAVAWDTGYLYVCIASNTWKRAALATW